MKRWTPEQLVATIIVCAQQLSSDSNPAYVIRYGKGRLVRGFTYTGGRGPDISLNGEVTDEQLRHLKRLVDSMRNEGSHFITRVGDRRIRWEMMRRRP